MIATKKVSPNRNTARGRGTGPREWCCWRGSGPCGADYMAIEPIDRHRREEQRQIRERAEVEAQRRPCFEGSGAARTASQMKAAAEADGDAR